MTGAMTLLDELPAPYPSVTSSYCKKSSGDVPTLLPWRVVDYWRRTNRPDPDDYELRS